MGVAYIEPEIEDYSNAIFLDILRAIKSIGFEIKFFRIRKKVKKSRQKYLKYPLLNYDEAKKANLLVVFSPYATSHKAKKWSTVSGVPLLHLESGFLYKSVLCDIKGFWGEASILESINANVNECMTNRCIEWSDKYISDMILSNISKRKQPTDHTALTRKFVFLPMQYMNDQSVLKFGNMDYRKFVDEVAKFCFKQGICLAIKKHPHAYRKEPNDVDNLIKKMKKRYKSTVQVVDGSIHWFCQNCLFMACMNTGAIADGLINGTIMSHCGQSIFANSGTVIHDDNVQKGLEKCLSFVGNREEISVIIKRQKAMIYYLYNKYLLLEEDAYRSEVPNEDKIINQLKIDGL